MMHLTGFCHSSKGYLYMVRDEHLDMDWNTHPIESNTWWINLIHAWMHIQFTALVPDPVSNTCVETCLHVGHISWLTLLFLPFKSKHSS